jgi:hypothetical protein
MGSVYSGAALVIIAAAGSDPSYGLPGVSVRPRHPQRRIKMGDWTLVEFRDRGQLQSSIKESTWAKRAWTYQEGYLAKRRLVFTDDEITYICDHGTCRETLNVTLLHSKLGAQLRMDDLFAYSAHQSMLTFDRPCLEGYSRDEIENYQECIEGYSRRQLSYESDVLDACSGVLAFLSNRRDEGDKKMPLLFFWGLRVFEDGLDLTWYHAVPGLRRHGFPTWTWAGSTGPMFHTRRHWEFMRDLDHLQVGVRCDAEDSCSQSDLDRTPAYAWQAMKDYYLGLLASTTDTQNPPQLLKLTGKCPRFRPAHANPPSPENGGKTEFWFAMAESATKSLFAPLSLDIEMTEAELGDCFILRIGGERYTDESDIKNTLLQVGPLFLILKPSAASGCYERVGIVDLGLDTDRPRWIRREETWELPLYEKRTVIIK